MADFDITNTSFFDVSTDVDGASGDLTEFDITNTIFFEVSMDVGGVSRLPHRR